MREVRKVWSIDLSRRRLLQRACAAGGAVAILAIGADAAMAGKIPQSAVSYRGSPKGGESCANCRLFLPPSACKSVEGTVSPQGWCQIYVKG